MAILCQALTVVSRVTTIEQRYPGGLEGFLVTGAGIRLSDGVLACASFMRPDDVGIYISEMSWYYGFRFLDREPAAVHMVVVDQNSGPTTICDWIETDLIDGVRWAWKAGREPGELVAYEGWTREGYDSLRFTPNEKVPDLVFEETDDPNIRKLTSDDGEEILVASPYGFESFEV